MTKAVAIANASAIHNLGLPRTINTPTSPLHIIHPRNRPAQVEFEPHAELQMMVPRELRESFYLTLTGRGEGRATYRNFRRFGTSARIVPEP